MWTASKVQEKLERVGFKVRHTPFLDYLAALLNENVPIASVPYRQDNVVIWKPGWPR